MDDAGEALAQHHDRCRPGGQHHRHPPGADEPASGLHRRVGGQQGHDREQRHQPAPEVALLVAHEHDERDRRRQQDECEREAPAHDEQDAAAHGGDRWGPAQSPRERPDVERRAPGGGGAELLRVRAAGQGLLGRHAGVEGREVQHRVWVGGDEGQNGAAQGEQQTAQRLGRRTPGGVADARRHQADRGDRPGVLGRRGQPDADPGQHVVAPGAVAQHPSHSVERERDRRERGDVVEREMAVEDRQEGQPEDRRAQQRDRLVEQALAGQVGQPHRHRPQYRGDDAGHQVHLGGVRDVGPAGRVGASEPQLEDEVQEVGVRGRVEKVLGVVVMAEERDCPGDEMRRLVRVVAVGQPLLDPPEAQGQGQRQQQPQRGPMQVSTPTAQGPDPSTATAVRGVRTLPQRREPTGWLGLACRCRVHLHPRVSRYRVSDSAPLRSNDLSPPPPARRGLAAQSWASAP